MTRYEKQLGIREGDRVKIICTKRELAKACISISEIENWNWEGYVCQIVKYSGTTYAKIKAFRESTRMGYIISQKYLQKI